MSRLSGLFVRVWPYRNMELQIQLLEEFTQRNLLLDHCMQLVDGDTLLGHGITVTYGNRSVFKCLMVDSHAERSTNGVLTAVTFSEIGRAHV